MTAPLKKGFRYLTTIYPPATSYSIFWGILLALLLSVVIWVNWGDGGQGVRTMGQKIQDKNDVSYTGPQARGGAEVSLATDQDLYSLGMSARPESDAILIDGESIDEINRKAAEYSRFLQSTENIHAQITSLSLEDWPDIAAAKDAMRNHIPEVEADPLSVSIFLSACSLPRYRNVGLLETEQEDPAYNHRKAMYELCEEYKQKARDPAWIDPFWVILERARGGDNLSKIHLFLSEFKNAISRNVVNVRKEPMDYLVLRDEIVAMADEMARSGVSAAARFLEMEYASYSPGGILPRDLLKAYYYALLVVKYDTMPAPRRGNRYFAEQLRRDMTEQELEQADRIRESLGFAPYPGID